MSPQLYAAVEKFSVSEFLERLKGVEGLAGKKAFAFDTKMKSRLVGNAGGKIENKLKLIGLTVVKRSESAVVLDREGPLEASFVFVVQCLGQETCSRRGDLS